MRYDTSTWNHRFLQKKSLTDNKKKLSANKKSPLQSNKLLQLVWEGHDINRKHLDIKISSAAAAAEYI
jgi:hypothetical protein